MTDKTKSARRFARTPKSDAVATDTPPATPSNLLETPIADAASPKRDSKSSRVLALLQRTDGATLDELIAETAWQPHTLRAALTGLRKKGHEIERSKRGEATCYRIAGEA